MHEVEGPDRTAQYRPKGHPLMLLLRAAMVDTGTPGPWLTLTRSYAATERRVYVHHISLTDVEPYSGHRLVMCSGTEALGFAFAHRWPSVTAPTSAELRELGEWCVRRVNAPLWDANQTAWLREYMGPAAKELRAREAADGAAHVRALRWSMAEQWLRQ